jgi:TPR repeat protein
MELNDPEAFHGMGTAVHGGLFGLKQDYTKAAEMLLKAVELGSVRAKNSLGDIYAHAEGVKKDLKKARYYFEHAAMGGSEEARYNLARLESGVGNVKRAVKHLMLGAEAGSDWCVDKIKDYFLAGICTKEEYAGAIRAHGACRDEMRSDSRDAAAKVSDELSRNNIKSREDLKRLGVWPASPALGAWPAPPTSQMKKRKHKKRAK